MENVKDKIDIGSLYIQRNQEFYNRKFKKMKDTGKVASWNWSAFFMGIYWMLYRKMYFKAGAFFILSFVASSTPYIGAILNICVQIGIAVYANYLYMDHVEESIKKISEKFPKHKEKIAEIKGGTNLKIAIGIGVIHFIAISIMMVLYL